MPDPDETVILELKPVADPQAEHGRPARDVIQRLKRILKRALRDEGFRCLRVMDGRTALGPPCPRCGQHTDDLGRCWRCYDWICYLCGKMTGSAVISTCLACQVEDSKGVE